MLTLFDEYVQNADPDMAIADGLWLPGLEDPRLTRAGHDPAPKAPARHNIARTPNGQCPVCFRKANKLPIGNFKHKPELCVQG